MQQASCQDKFVKYRERVSVDKNRTLCDLELGWYSKDDMLKVLKWPLKLVRTLVN